MFADIYRKKKIASAPQKEGEKESRKETKK